MSGFQKLVGKYFGKRTRRASRQRTTRRGYAPKVEILEAREMLAVTAVFSATTGALNVYGDSGSNTIEISRNAGGGILVNNGAVSIVGGSPTVVNTALIRAFGLGGDDTITLNETNGPLPRAHLYGGSGVDTLAGGSGADLLFGQSGDDAISGNGGSDLLFGGSADDTLLGGDADDFTYGQSNNDRMIWNPGDDTDLNEGGAGIDIVEVNGDGVAEAFTTTANGTRVRFDRLNPAPFAIDIGTSESLIVNMNGGQDSFSATGNLAALIQITVDGGADNDTILGSNGADLLNGGAGDDFIDGQQGSDVMLGGENNDAFQWDPGDGSDTVEGQAGNDTLVMNGSNGAEIFDLSANGSRVRLTRNLGNIVMDIDGVERFDVNAFAGGDTIAVNDLTGTAATQINLALNANGVPDTVADLVIVNATSGEDVVFVTGNASGVAVSGLSALINILNLESALDRLTTNLLAGDDILDASGLAATGTLLTVDGGDDDDAISGGDGADTLFGGIGDDVLIGGPGTDVLDGGPGDNVLIQ